MARSGQDAICCGTCGFVACDAVPSACRSSACESAAATGADALVTSCPKCLIHFSCAQADARRRGAEAPAIEIPDLADSVAGSLRGAPVQAPSNWRVIMSRRALRIGVFVCDCGLNIAGSGRHRGAWPATPRPCPTWWP